MTDVSPAQTSEERLAEIAAQRTKLLAELASLDEEERALREVLAEGLNGETTCSAENAASRALTQAGAASAMAFLDAASDSDRDAAIAAATLSFRRLIASPHGHTFAQKVLDRAQTAQLDGIIDALFQNPTDLVAVASTSSGARVLQRLVELLSSETLASKFVQLLAPIAPQLALDANACHVVQRVLSPRFLAAKDVLVRTLSDNTLTLAVNKQGCCVIQRCIELVHGPQRDALIATVLGHSLKLVQDAFGNYVVQFLLDQNDDTLTTAVIEPLLHNVAALSRNKFGSNVVEKCIKRAPPHVRQLLLDEILEVDVLPALLQDSFANYVIQAAIQMCDEQQFEQLHAAVYPQVTTLRNSPYSARIESKMVRRAKDIARGRSKAQPR